MEEPIRTSNRWQSSAEADDRPVPDVARKHGVSARSTARGSISARWNRPTSSAGGNSSRRTGG